MKRASNELEALLKKAAKRKETLHAADVAIAKEKAALEAPPAPAPAPEPAAAPDEADTTTKPEEMAEPTMVPAIFIFAAAPSSIEPLSVAGKVVGDEDPLVAMLAGLDAEQPAAAQLLQGGWIRAHYHTRRPCPPEVLRWLFAVTCHHRRPHVSAAAAHTLGSLLSAAPAVPAWVPSPTDFLKALHQHGASLTELDEPADASSVPALAEESALLDPRHNLLALLEVLSPSARWWGSLVDKSERLDAARWMMRLMLEPHAAPAFVHLQDAVAALLDTAPVSEWDSAWLPGLVERLERLGERLPHSALVRLCGFLPPTLRAQAVQHRVAIGAVRLLTRRRRQQKLHKARLEAAERRKERAKAKEARAARAARADADAEEEEEEEEGDDDDDDDDEEEEDSEKDVEESAGAQALVTCVQKLDVSLWRGQLEAVHSVLLLIDLALSAEPHALRPQRSEMQELKRLLNMTKSKIVKNRGVLDYHGLEAESLAAFLVNKIDHCFFEHE